MAPSFCANDIISLTNYFLGLGNDLEPDQTMIPTLIDYGFCRERIMKAMNNVGSVDLEKLITDLTKGI